MKFKIGISLNIVKIEYCFSLLRRDLDNEILGRCIKKSNKNRLILIYYRLAQLICLIPKTSFQFQSI